MSPHYDSRCDSPAIPRMRLSDGELQLVRHTLQILNELRGHAEQAQAQELHYALYRAGEVLAMLTRHRGEVWLR